MNEFNSSRLKYFAEVLACGSVRGAAEKLDTSPPVVSRQIQLLEKEIGFLLFERRARGLVPTDAAEIINEFLLGYNAQHEHLKNRLDDLRGLNTGRVDIVVSEGVVESLMQHVVGPFCTDYPRIKIGINIGSVTDVVETLRSDRAHIGIAFNPPVHPDVKVKMGKSLPVELMVSPRHPFAKSAAPVKLHDILSQPLAVMASPYGLRRIVDLIEYNEKIRFSPTLVTNSISVIKHYVLSNAGVALMTMVGVESEVAKGSLVLLPLDNQTLSQPECRVLVRNGRPLSPAVNELLKRLKTRMPLFRQG
jgi:DNA-binding transcriptional LysR family regulator